jgi:riboflavin biosynthesis pyrimidine reductase
LPSSPLRIEVLGEGDSIPPRALIDVVRRAGARVVLCEGGPHLLGQLLGAGLVDGLFLTILTQLVGRNLQNERLSLVEGATLLPGPGRWASLRSVHRSRDFLFLRYRLNSRAAPIPGLASG